MIDFFTSDLFFLVIAPATVIAFCVLLIFLAVSPGKKRSAQVRITEKYIKRAYKRVGSKGSTYGICYYEYYVTFRLENGKKRERQCSEEFYNEIQVGDEGIMTYNRFIVAFDKSGRNFVYGEQ